jgi:signal transduction histidine kinase
VISRSFLSSIAFRLPFAIVSICFLVFCLAAVAIYGLQRARDEMASYGLQAYASLAKASLVSRQVSDLVSNASFLMNATSPYRMSSESRAIVAQVDTLLRAMEPDAAEAALVSGFVNTQIVDLLGSIRTQTLALASDADSAQQYKAEAAAALGEIATGNGMNQGEQRRSLNGLTQSAFASDSLFQLGELRRRYIAETMQGAAANGASWAPLAPYEQVFEAQTRYLLEMFAIRSAVSRLHAVERDLSRATEMQSAAVTQGLSNDLASTSEALSRLTALVGVAGLLVLAMAAFSIRSAMRASRGIVALSNGMNALAKGHKDVAVPAYLGTETELLRLLDAFRVFRESVERVSRLRRTTETAARTIRSTFRNMNEGIALFDASGRSITMNRRVMELVGWAGPARRPALRTFIASIPEVDATLLPCEEARGLLSGQFVVRHRSFDGRVVEISLSRQSDDGIVLLARDVTEMDRQEAEAVKAHRLDGIMRMTHQLSHEVGNMIGIITGSLGLLERESGFTDRQRRHLARISKAADRGRSLAGSMLSIGAQQQINPDRVDVGALLRAMADVLEIAVGEKCGLAFEIAKGLPAVLLDAALFEQAILNLCLNAAAAMPEGGTIQVRCARRAAGVVVAVADNGIGMTPEAVGRAFEPYFTTREADGGAGLGLAVVYGFVRQSGGDATINSARGLGTTVELFFPPAKEC